MTNIYIEQLREQINTYKKYAELADKADKAYEADPMNEALEHEADVYYTKEIKALTQATNLIKVMAKTDTSTARKMVITKTDEIIGLVSMVA